MKKILITVMLATAVAVSTRAQGLVIFSSSTQNISTNNPGIAALGATAAGRTAASAGNFYYALFYSASATTVSGSSAASQGLLGTYAFNDANWSLVAYGANTATTGRFAASTPNGDGSTTVTGLAAGNSAQFVVLGWSANLGSTISALETSLGTFGTTGFIGESAVSGTIATGNGGLLPTPNLFGANAPQMQAFTLGGFQVVPEPGTLALAALGGASLLLFRRKK